MSRIDVYILRKTKHGKNRSSEPLWNLESSCGGLSGMKLSRGARANLVAKATRYPGFPAEATNMRDRIGCQNNRAGYRATLETEYWIRPVALPGNPVAAEPAKYQLGLKNKASNTVWVDPKFAKMVSRPAFLNMRIEGGLGSCWKLRRNTVTDRREKQQKKSKQQSLVYCTLKCASVFFHFAHSWTDLPRLTVSIK